MFDPNKFKVYCPKYAIACAFKWKEISTKLSPPTFKWSVNRDLNDNVYLKLFWEILGNLYNLQHLDTEKLKAF